MINILYAMLTVFVTQAAIRLLISFGLAIGTYSLISDWIDSALQFAVNGISTLGQVGTLLYVAGVGESLSIIGSAATSVAAIMAAKTFIGKS